MYNVLDVCIMIFIALSIIAGDEPEDGPQSYVILTGFTDAELVQELISINVNVHSVVRFLSETISKGEL